ncbi:PTS sugar transporter subunit IIA [Aquabacterium sp. OR-4]|uniref:PTS sugar transporter subunit IIA n=1 Tax=Aquabacterium sp. OR-4 TaxID=2978127 RepID=UPI0021B1C86D|nr:PTS fructose transporter subunit IIA [Aquabacterium sp. OR-4]MDT7834279.1 PTS fructose transporter subunit IIA [Aquabacterium sp. OR-4]
MPTGLFIIAHQPLATALRSTALHAFPDSAAAIAVYDVPAGCDTERYLGEAEALVAAMPWPETLILTDVVGATPANLAAQLVKQGRRRALAGVNVPMVWRAHANAHLPLDELWSKARDGALAAVQPVSTPPPQNQAQKASAHAPNDRHHQQ